MKHFCCGRLSCLFFCRCDSGCCTYLSLYSSLWKNPSDSLCRSVLSDGFSYGLLVILHVVSTMTLSIPLLNHYVPSKNKSFLSFVQVMSVKAVGIALKLTFSGMNQFIYFQTWIFTVIVIFCCLMQINYLNKVDY